MHKRSSIQRDSIRLAKVTQSALDAINVRIEKEKTRKIRNTTYAKIRMWNELKNIHRVFVPQYVPKSEKEQSVNNVNKSITTKSGVSQELGRKVDLSPSQLRKRSHCNASNLTRMQNESGVRSRDSAFPELAKPLFKQKLGSKRSSIFQPASVDDDDLEAENRRRRSGTWPLGGVNRKPAREETRANSQDYVNKLLQVNVEPCVSASMSSVTSGYLMFKRLLRRRQGTAADTQYVSSKYRESSCEDDDAGTNSMLVLPEKSQIKSTDPKQNLDMIEAGAKDKLCPVLNTQARTWKTPIPMLKNNFLSADDALSPGRSTSSTDARGTRPRLEANVSWSEGLEPRRRAQSLIVPTRSVAHVEKYVQSNSRPSQYSQNTPLPNRSYDNDSNDSVLGFRPDASSQTITKRPILRHRALSDSAAFQTGGLVVSPARRDLRLSPVMIRPPNRLSTVSPRRERVASNATDTFVTRADRHVPVVKFSNYSQT